MTRTSCNTIGVRHTHTSKYVTWCEVKLLVTAAVNVRISISCALERTYIRSHVHVHTFTFTQSCRGTRDELLLRRTRDAAG